MGPPPKKRKKFDLFQPLITEFFSPINKYKTPTYNTDDSDSDTQNNEPEIDKNDNTGTGEEQENSEQGDCDENNAGNSDDNIDINYSDDCDDDFGSENYSNHSYESDVVESNQYYGNNGNRKNNEENTEIYDSDDNSNYNENDMAINIENEEDNDVNCDSDASESLLARYNYPESHIHADNDMDTSGNQYHTEDDYSEWCIGPSQPEQNIIYDSENFIGPTQDENEEGSQEDSEWCIENTPGDNAQLPVRTDYLYEQNAQHWDSDSTNISDEDLIALL